MSDEQAHSQNSQSNNVQQPSSDSVEPSQEIWNSAGWLSSEPQQEDFLSPLPARRTTTDNEHVDTEIVPATPSVMSTTGGTDEIATPSRSLSEVVSTASTGRQTPRKTERDSLRRHELGDTSFSLFSPEKSAHARIREIQDNDKVTEQIEKRVIWGTNVNVDECDQKIKQFLKTFTLESLDTYYDEKNLEEVQSKPYYLQLLTNANEMQYEVINIDLQHILKFDPDLYYYIIAYPTELIAIFDQAIQELYKEMFPQEEDATDSAIDSPFQLCFHGNKLITRMYNLKDTEIHSMREIDPCHIHQMIGVRGMVVRCSSVIPNLNRAFYRCNNCFESIIVDVYRGKIEEPTHCDKCRTRNSFMLIHNRSVFSDKQMIRVQETPESVPQGETPATMTLITYDSLVDSVRPGDQVEVTGILRAVSVRLNPKQRNIRAVFRTYLDAVHILKKKEGRLSKPVDSMEVTSDYYPIGVDTQENALYFHEKERIIQQISQDPQLYDLLSRSIAPSIWGLHDLKKGLLLQLFGGTSKNFSAKGGGHFRSDIHILLVGDPGTSKSLFLQYVHRIAPRGLYTSGRGSSAVGLTAYVTRDPDSNDMVLESGALVLSDRGICCIDEFDKMTESTRTILHEAMEQQTVSIAKAGIICSLNARTSILAAANPIESKYNPKLSVVDNIQLPPTLLSRFDLIYLILDKSNPEEDRKLGNHIASLFSSESSVVYSDDDPLPQERIFTSGTGGDSTQSYLDTAILTCYISYAREKIHPKLSDEAVASLTKGYVEMRKIGSLSRQWSQGGVKTITATPRQLESLIRLSEAHARMRLCERVEQQDVDEAIRLVQVAIQQSAIDPVTGTIDMDLITTGKSATRRSRVAKLSDSMIQCLQEMSATEKTIKISDLFMEIKRISSMQFAESEFEEAIQSLVDQEKVIRTTGGVRVSGM